MPISGCRQVVNSVMIGLFIFMLDIGVELVYISITVMLHVMIHVTIIYRKFYYIFNYKVCD